MLNVVGLQQTAVNGLLYQPCQQSLLSTASWSQSTSSLGLQCVSAMMSTFANRTLPSPQLVCSVGDLCIMH